MTTIRDAITRLESGDDNDRLLAGYASDELITAENVIEAARALTELPEREKSAMPFSVIAKIRRLSIRVAEYDKVKGLK